jgi:plasmid stability protein
VVVGASSAPLAAFSFTLCSAGRKGRQNRNTKQGKQMITLEIDGNKVEAENEKEARKLLAKMVKEQRKQQEKNAAAYSLAKMKAESAAYRVLARKAEAEEFPRLVRVG